MSVVLERVPLQRLVNPLHDARGLVDARVREEDPELVAAEAREDVGRAQLAADQVREADQRGVAGGVPELVVDRLEAVEIEQRQRAAAAAQRLVEEADVVDAGERIVRRERDQLLLLRDVAERQDRRRLALAGE